MARFLGIIGGLLVIAALGPVVTMLAWNNVVPLFWHAAPHFNYWNALAVNVLLSILKTPFSFSLTKE